MKIKKISLVILLVGGLLAGWSLQAAAAWYTCTVNEAGPLGTNETSGSRICLTDTADPANFPARQEFKIPAARAKEFLAVALTAMASDKKVKISSALTGTVPTIKAIYLLDQ